MASLSRSRYGGYALAFRYAGTRFNRSLRTKNVAIANRLRGAVEIALEKVEAGLIPTPPHMTPDQLWRILITGSPNYKRAEISKLVTIEVVNANYLDSYGLGSKELTTIQTESHHLNHLQRLLGPETSLSEITPAKLREYVKMRQAEPGRHGKNISPVTISKELATFRQLWEFARSENLVAGENPLGSVRKPRPQDKPRFMTRGEIEKANARGGLTTADIAQYWECLFLSEQDIGQFLRHVKARCAELPRFRYIYAALSFCAYTGCRRSEMFRAQHFDIEGATIQIREKKRSQRVTYSIRQVPMHPNLKIILDEFMGHQTDASRRRYRHLFPEQLNSAISVLNFEDLAEAS